MVGENPASESFLKQKAKVAEILGVNFKVFRYDAEIKTEKLIKEILKINENSIKNNYTTSRRSSANGIIIQLPLPKHIKTESVLNVINPKKDIDALSKLPLVLAPTVEAVKFIFKKYKINYKTKNILIIGHGRLIGQPIYNWFNSQFASQETSRSLVRQSLNQVRIIDVKQKNQLLKLAREADIIIGGTGKAGLIKDSMIKKNSILIDFGFSRKNGPPMARQKKFPATSTLNLAPRKPNLLRRFPAVWAR